MYLNFVTYSSNIALLSTFTYKSFQDEIRNIIKTLPFNADKSQSCYIRVLVFIIIVFSMAQNRKHVLNQGRRTFNPPVVVNMHTWRANGFPSLELFIQQQTFDIVDSFEAVALLSLANPTFGLYKATQS